MVIDRGQNVYGINNFINTPLWNVIEEQLNSSNLNWEDGIANTIDGRNHLDIRKTKIAWIVDRYVRTQLFHSVDSYNKENWNYDLDGCDALQYGIYSDGGHYNWHVDHELEIAKIDNKSLIRKLSVTIWLNDPDEYEGGELDIEVYGPYENKRYDTLKLSKGSIVIFPSDKWHRVRPVTSGVRKSLVTWFRGPPFK
tara:strand:- start:339 stop:926 length:588 start_codon:yes stop_codon:yes gene_type:complete